MTVTQAPETPAAPAASSPMPHGNPWLPTPSGVWLVTRIELLRRRPSPKGWVFYGILAAVIIGLGALLSVTAPDTKDSVPMELIVVLVLGAGMLIAPSLAATSINGDSAEGVLAPLQMTRLTAGDLALGKLLASWLIAFAVLLTTTPFLLYAFSRSGWHWQELLVVLGAVLLVVLTATAIGLAWSALAARAVASVSLAHLTTGALMLGTVLAFFFTQPLVSEPVREVYRNIDWATIDPEVSAALDNAYMTGDFSDVDVDALVCTESSTEYGVAHTERTAWLLLANPVVMIAETSPIISYETWEQDGRAAPGLFAELHRMVSDARIGPGEVVEERLAWDECADIAAMAAGDGGMMGDDGWAEDMAEASTYARAPWIGLGVQLVVLVGAVWIVVNRLRVPYKKLRAGTRVA